MSKWLEGMVWAAATAAFMLISSGGFPATIQGWIGVVGAVATAIGAYVRQSPVPAAASTATPKAPGGATAIAIGLALATAAMLSACDGMTATQAVQKYDQFGVDGLTNAVAAYAADPKADPATVTKLQNLLKGVQSAVTVYNSTPTPTAQTAVQAAVAALIAADPGGVF